MQLMSRTIREVNLSTRAARDHLKPSGIAHIDRDLSECPDMRQSDRTSLVAEAAPVREGRHPATFAPATLILIVVLSVFGAVIGVQLIVQLGVTPNTSIIGWHRRRDSPSGPNAGPAILTQGATLL